MASIAAGQRLHHHQIIAEDIYGPRVESNGSHEMGELVHATADVTDDIAGCFFDVADVGYTIAGEAQPKAFHVLGIAGGLGSAILGVQPILDGARQVRSAIKANDAFGHAMGLTKIATGGGSILGGLAGIPKAVIDTLEALRPISAELIAASAVLEVLTEVFSFIVFASILIRQILVFSEVIRFESDLKTCLSQGMSAKELVTMLQVNAKLDSAFRSELLRLADDEVMKSLSEGECITGENEAKKILETIFSKIKTRKQTSALLFVISALSLVASIGALLVSGGPLSLAITVLSACLGVVALIMDVPAFLEALKEGDRGQCGRVVMAFLSSTLVGTVVAACILFSSSGLALGILGTVALLTLALQQLAFWYKSNEAT